MKKGPKGPWVWNKNFVRLIASNLASGKTKAEICAAFNLSPAALQVGMSRFKDEINKVVAPKPAEPKVEKETINILNKYVTKWSKYPVRFYADDGYSDYPIHGAVLTDRGWECCSWSKYGKFMGEFEVHKNDLLKVEEILPSEVWVWIGVEGKHESFSSYEKAANWQLVKGGKIFPLSVPNE